MMEQVEGDQVVGVTFGVKQLCADQGRELASLRKKTDYEALE